ncbi:VCBS domain-containing protein [Vibrio sp. F12]|uniref:VCBS domain-containing protein n=1 Tax=Vibrio sp. F12 TaxID=2070776 RepID=UPI001F110173|nr:VCBS domain-containing protein [Vibrio sp. F12]
MDETDKAVTTSGTLASTDVDNPDNTFTPYSISGTNGDLTIDANGHWVFTASSAFNQLNVGDKVEETFTVSSIDGTTSTVKVTINGTNDAATVSSATVAIDETDKALTTSGTLTSTDVDNPDNTFTPDSITGTNGDLTIDANGHWAFTANSAFNQLNVGDKVEETFTVSSVDGTSSTIKVTINGTNDVATVSTATVSVDETDKAVTTSGTLTSTDVDNPDNTFTPDSIVGANGDLTIDANGHWVFTANSAFNQLNVGDKVEETFTVSSIDGTTSTVKVTINGTNDAATVSSATVAIDETDKAVTTSGTLTSTDVDNPDNAFTPDSISGTKGDLTIDANGHWTFTANNAFNQLNVGDKVEETFTVSSIDGTTSTIKVTINGTNDAPVINAQSHSVVEGGSLLNGQMVGHDIDTGATLIYSAPQVDGLVLNPDGSYSFDPNHASYLSLASGTTKTLTIPVTLTDEHHASNTQNLSITITGANNSATISGVSTGDVDEGHGSYGDMSPDYAHPGMAKLGQDAITADGKLDIVDPDSGEAQFDPKGGAWNNSYHGQYGHLLLNSDGTWHYDVTVGGSDWVGNKKTTIGTTIDQLGEGQTLTDTITIQSKDGTTHDIVITIHGDNDRPYCSSEVQLNSGKEDTSQTLTTKELLSNTIDVDNNDAGILSIANLHSNHGSIRDNHDGTYTFTPAKDYNGQVHFTYDVKDAHGGVTATGANMNLQGVADKALIGGQHVGDITEDHLTPHLAQLTVQGHLTVVDPDGGEAHFTSVTKIDDPYNTNHDGLILSPSGAWHYGVNNYLVQHMAEGETKDIVYEVSTVDGTKQLITITLHGTNDNPELLFSGYGNLSGGPSPITTDEDKAITISVDRFMSAKDIDHGDTLHLEQLHVDHGTAVLSPDGKSVIYTPEKDFNGQVTFTYAIMDNNNAQAIDTGTGKTALSGMVLTVNAVDDVAVITGTDTGSVTEDVDPYTPVSWLPNMIHTTGQLSISDPDTGEDHFDFKSFIKVASHPEWAPYQSQLGGKLSIDKNGSWEYVIDTTKPNIQALGDGESLVDRVLIHSSDGTQHTIEVTIHGTNDAPVVTQATLLPAGVEDTRMTLTASQLLANAIDIDNNDVGLLTVANLNVDHGSVHLNPDGTYTFTPAKDYNGQVHFTYDVKDAHGGVTHAGASTTLAAVDDKTIISGIDHGVATEDIATHMSTSANIMDAVDWQALQITDVDSPNTQVTVEFAGKQYTWNIGSDLDVTTPYGKFQFHTIASGSHKGEHSWSYIGDNNNVHVQELKHGESLTESIKLIATDGTEFPITVKVNGTEDGIIIDSKSELGHVVENAQTGASVSGNVIAHDVDLHDTVSWTQTPTAGLNGQYGTFHLSADGQWHYDVDQSKATKLGDGDEYWEHFTVEAVSTDGSHVSKSVSVVVHGNNDAPTVSGEVTLPSGKEDTSIHITQAELIANATDVDTNDRGWLHVENLTADHGSLVSNSDGSFTFNPDPNYNGTVHFTYDVADRHGGIAHTGANTSLAAVNDAATFAGDSSSIKEDTNIHHNAHITGSATIPDALSCHGHLIVSDADGHGEAALDLKGQPKISLDGTYGHFDITSTGTWVYKADNKSTPIQDLDNGQTLTDSIEVTSKDGTKHSITVTINGTTDDPVLHSLSDSGVQHSGPVEGNLLTGSGTDQGLSGAATDTDSNAHLVLQDIQIKDPVSGYVAVRPGQPHTMAGIGTLAIEANGHYTFTPEADFTGKVPSMVYRVGDDGGNPIGDSSQNSLSIEVTLPLQHAPTVRGQTVSTNEDITRTFTTSEFGYSDQDGDTLQFVTISSIPSHGLLLLNGNAVTANQQISKADLDAGHLTFTPINNENGANYAQFTFTANDGHKNSANATMVVDVNAVNDAPIVGSSFISSLEDKPHAFTTADFKYSDIDGDALNHITITNVAHGVLSLNGATVNVGDDVSASDVSSLIFTPTHNYFSSGVSGLGGVQFTANDGHLDSKEGSILINIASVADPATFSGDSTGVAKEDITLQASGTLTASDPDGTAGFTAVQGGAGIAGSKGYGHAHIDVNGHWTYDLDNNHPIVQQLGEGQTDTETITVQSADGTHHDIVVTITGTNDAPILGVNQTSSTAGTLTETDVDVNDTHTFSVVSSTGQFGSLSVDPNTGDYIYTPNTSITGMSYNSATNSYHGVDVFEVKVSDQHAESSKFITFDASGHVTMSPTGSLVISTTVPQHPTVTATQPTLSSGTNVAPTNTVTLDLASTSDSGSSNTDNLTNDTTPTITGHTDIPYSQVTIYDGSTPVGHAVSDASGQYSVAVSGLSEGDHNLSAKTLAPSSVLPATSSLLSVHIDTQVHVGIQTDPITADNVVNAQESNSSIDITGSVSGDYNAGDIVTLDVNGTQHTGVVDAKGHYSIAVPGSELIADADQKIEASVAVTDTAGNSAHATADVTYQVDTQVSVPTITFENAGADNLYSKAEIARGQANTITATVTPPGDAKIGEHLVVNGQDHVLDAHTLQHGIQIEVHPGSNVQATMTDEHGNTAGSQGFAASAIPEPIIVRPPSGSHQVSGTLGVPPLLPSLTPVPTAQSGWRIHLPNGQYVTSHQGQYGTLTIDPQTGQLHYQEQAQVHTGPHGSTSGIGQHEDKFEVALQGTNQDEVVAHVNIQILSHGPGGSGKLTIGTEVVDMTITPVVHTSHPAPPPPTPVQHDEPDMTSQSDVMVTQSDDIYLDLTQQTHQEPDQKTSHHGAAAYLDALGIKPDATSTTVHDQPADMDIVLAQVDQPDAVTNDQAHLDMSDALEHHDASVNHNQDDEHHHHNDVDGLPDIDPNS